LIKHYDSSDLVETDVWKIVKTIEPGKSYVIVSANSGLAMTTAQVSVPAGNGVSVAQTGRGGAAVTIEGDYIVTPRDIPANMIWEFTTAGAHPSPGPFAGQTGILIRNGTNYLQRGSSSSQATAPLNIGTSTATNNMAIFFFTSPDATGRTSACLYSANDANNHWVFALFGNASGFVGEGGNIVNGENPAPYQAKAPLLLYEKVTEMRPVGW